MSMQTCRSCNTALTEENWCEEPWIEFYQDNWCNTCWDNTAQTITCVDCHNETLGHPGIDYTQGWNSITGESTNEYQCNLCGVRAYAQSLADTAATAPQL